MKDKSDKNKSLYQRKYSFYMLVYTVYTYMTIYRESYKINKFLHHIIENTPSGPFYNDKLKKSHRLRKIIFVIVNNDSNIYVLFQN
jgi:hypothetical protein